MMNDEQASSMLSDTSLSGLHCFCDFSLITSQQTIDACSFQAFSGKMWTCEDSDVATDKVRDVDVGLKVWVREMSK